jgi:N-acetylglucosamine-6-phosphate deacetylase
MTGAVDRDRPRRTVLAGGEIVLPQRVLGAGTIVIEHDRIVDVLDRPLPPEAGAEYVDCHGRFLVPGFIDVHVHGVDGTDALDGAGAIGRIAERLPRYGTTAFCPTSIACAPLELRAMLDAVRDARTSAPRLAARVLPAHLESNFINPEYRGAQPLECLRVPSAEPVEGSFSGEDILREIRDARPDVGIVTIAPEIGGAIGLIRELTSQRIHVSLGHSGATYEQALEGIDAGARQATHLFNRMPPLGHRAPGLTAAVLEHDELCTEIVCDGVHVHPAMVRVALSAKRPSHVMAITDGTAGSGLAQGARTRLGGRPVTVRDAAYLDDGTLAGSVLTMNQAFARLVTMMGLSLPDAATVCATTPARALDLHDFGVIAAGAVADLVVLDRNLAVDETFIGGLRVWPQRD